MDAAAIMSRILIISFSPIARDPRVLRQIETLRQGSELTVAGYGPFRSDGITFVDLPRNERSPKDKIAALFLLPSSQAERFYFHHIAPVKHLMRLNWPSFDLVIANDYDTAPAAFRLAGAGPFVVDLHEYALDEQVGWRARLLWGRLREWCLSEYLSKSTGTSTVCDSIADRYSEQLGIPRPIVVPNAAQYEDLPVHTTDSRRVRLVHHGACAPGRGLEVLLSAIDSLDERFELHLYLVGMDTDYGTALARRAAEHPRVFVHPPVETRLIARELNQYDVGLFVLPPWTFNHLHALPNKLFEFVQARLAIVVGPSPDMASMVQRYGLGVVTPSFDSADLARALTALSAHSIDEYKRASQKAAPSVSWEAFAPRLMSLVSRAVGASGQEF
jgi:glycosyltransferase involved in cell wall biosynthesis